MDVLAIWLGLLLQLPTSQLPLPACTAQFIPLETGTSYGDSDRPWWAAAQIGDWRGDGWLGWRSDGDALLPVTLRVEERGGADEQEVEVSIAASPEVDFLVRCVPRVGQQPIQALPVVNVSLEPSRPLALHLGARAYELRLESSRDDLFDARVVLREGTHRQVLYDAGGFTDEPHYDIVWAGDLDSDGRLDLVVNLSRKYSVHPYRLLLSSAAAGGDLVGDAAIFETGD